MQNQEKDQASSLRLLHPADTACDEWLDRTLEDTFPASDPLGTYRFD